MNHRRKFMLNAGALLLPPMPLAAHAAAGRSYAEATHATWRHTDAPPTGKAALQRELARYATLGGRWIGDVDWVFKALPVVSGPRLGIELKVA